MSTKYRKSGGGSSSGPNDSLWFACLRLPHVACASALWALVGCGEAAATPQVGERCGPERGATAATAAVFTIQVGISPTRRWATMSSSLESAVLELLWIREWPSLHVWRCRSHAPHIVRAPKARVGGPTLTSLSTGSVPLPQAFADSQHLLVLWRVWLRQTVG